MVLEKLSVQNAREPVNYLITEVLKHVRCAVELRMRLVPHAAAQVKLFYTKYQKIDILPEIVHPNGYEQPDKTIGRKDRNYQFENFLEAGLEIDINFNALLTERHKPSRLLRARGYWQIRGARSGYFMQDSLGSLPFLE